MNKQQYLKQYYLLNKKALSTSKSAWYKKNKVRLLEKSKVYSAQNREKINARRREARKKPTHRKWSGYTPQYKEKQKVRRKVRYAIQKGLLVRLPCIHCGQLAHAHHEDYTKPLEVVWLCRKHHNERHRQLFLL